MSKRILFVGLACALLLAESCQEQETAGPEPGEPAGLPLLPAGQYAGIIRGFNPDNPPATQDSVADRWQEALSAGMAIHRLQIDWPDLEPFPNRYDLSVLENRLQENKKQGLHTFLLISAYDSGGPVVPSDLSGLPFDHPQLINRFKQLMDRVIPTLIANDGYLIAIANEPDNGFGEIADLDQQIGSFLTTVKEHIHSLDHRIAVTITLAEGSLDEHKPGLFDILSACDVHCWNYYGARSLPEYPFYPIQSEKEVRADIRRMLSLADHRSVVIQEVGLWSGQDRLNSSPLDQARFFSWFFDEMGQHPRLRAAYVFQMVDWSASATALITQEIPPDSVPNGFLEALSESLLTMGLVDYHSGSAKPAWAIFAQAVSRFGKN